LRAFLALDVPDNVQERLGRLVAILAPLAKHVKWVPAHQIHLTLTFFKDLSARTLEDMHEPVGALAAGTHPFVLQAAGAGAFGPSGRPNVIWCGVEDSGGRLAAFVSELQKTLACLGVAPEGRPFHPHLTLGRVKGGAEHALSNAIPTQNRFEAGAIAADHLTLYESQLSSSGPSYRVLRTWPFTGGS
jgi:RNA 2',3'-cyclic 3'-phosphodiesterase